MKALLRGASVEFDGTAEEYARLDAITPCGACGRCPTAEGHDGCLGTLPSVEYACCGHGTDNSYILFANGVEVRGFRVEAPRRDLPPRGE